MSETVALIPARGGSKRVYRKNIRVFQGRPIIAWPIEAAQSSKLFDRIIVSTDNHDIAEIARQEGAEIPFIRPAELADDKIGVTPVVQHAIQELRKTDISIRELCLIYATAPFLRSADLKRGQDVLHTECCNYALSVTTFSAPIQRAFKITNNGRLTMFYPENFNSRSQDLEPAYHDAARSANKQAWINNLNIYGPDTVPVTLPRHLVQDIDTEEDWESAEWMFKALKDCGEI